MRIGELARRAHVSRDTIRYYERRGLLGSIDRETGPNDYKDYPEESFTRLSMIRYLKRLGFTLGEVRQAIGPWVAGGIERPAKAERIRQKLTEVENRLD